ncbi:MAG: hypothetical protein ACO1TE_06270 [Prosthecobacter sp.]
MFKRLSFFVVIALLPAVRAADLPALRQSYENAVKRSQKSLAETYLAELARLKASASPDEAAKIDLEVQRVSKQIAELSLPATAQSVVLETQALVHPTSPAGFSLGAVKQGDTITLKYVKGMWKSDGRVASENPDAFKLEYGDKSRLVIAEAPVNGVPGKVLAMVTPETVRTPFTHTFTTDLPVVVLRINDNSTDTKNPGAVTYEVKITR